MDLDRTMTEPGGHAAQERLSAPDLDRGDLLAVSHLHRYEFAAELCEGARVLDLCCGTGYGARLLGRRAASVHGVDVAAEAVSAAEDSLSAGERERITFEQADALAYVRSLPQDRFDVVVCFEGIEHVPDPDELLEELARVAESPARLILSLPNSRGFEEHNEFHVTDYGFEEMQAAARRLGRPVIVEQRLGEASLLLPSWEHGPLALRGGLTQPVSDDGAWANHWLLLVNIDAAVVEEVRVRLSLAAAANPNAYMRQLEQANAELLQANRRLARQWLGIHDAAAAAVVRRLEERVEAAERDVEQARYETRQVQAEADKWQRIADDNDWGRRALETRLAEPRYAAVDAARDRLLAVPGGGALSRLAGRLLGRRRA
jgi:SAM-dependent methyltransferase